MIDENASIASATINASLKSKEALNYQIFMKNYLSLGKNNIGDSFVNLGLISLALVLIVLQFTTGYWKYMYELQAYVDMWQFAPAIDV